MLNDDAVGITVGCTVACAVQNHTLPRIDVVASSMLLLIDAYNLLHQSDQLQRGRADGWLARARERLIVVLARCLGAELCRQTCLVFDASTAPKSLPDTQIRHAIELRFAVDHDEADDLLEELIARHPTPKRLMVVSSDHRIQKAASRRGAKFMDSDLWYSELIEHRTRLAIAWPPLTDASEVVENEKPLAPTDQDELEAWLKEFSDVEATLTQPDMTSDSKWRTPLKAEPGGKPNISGQKKPKGKKEAGTGEVGSGKSNPKDLESTHGKPDPTGPIDPDLANPFPEGYGEDLLE